MVPGGIKTKEEKSLTEYQNRITCSNTGSQESRTVVDDVKSIMSSMPAILTKWRKKILDSPAPFGSAREQFKLLLDMACRHLARQWKRPGDQSRSPGPVIIMQRIQYRNKLAVRRKERKEEKRKKRAKRRKNEQPGTGFRKTDQASTSVEYTHMSPTHCLRYGIVFRQVASYNSVACFSFQHGSTTRKKVNKGEKQSVNLIANFHF